MGTLPKARQGSEPHRGGDRGAGDRGPPQARRQSWAQIGSDAIAWELAKLGGGPPTTRTIERILARAGLVRPRRRERPASKGLPYPAPRAEAVGDLQQADLVGPRHLDGGLPFVAFNCVDLAAHAAAIEIAPDQGEAT